MNVHDQNEHTIPVIMLSLCMCVTFIRTDKTECIRSEHKMLYVVSVILETLDIIRLSLMMRLTIQPV